MTLRWLMVPLAITICCMGNEYPAKAELSPSQRFMLDQIKNEIQHQQFKNDLNSFREYRERQRERFWVEGM